MTIQKTPIIVVKNLRRSFPAGETMVDILKGIDLTLYQGEMVAIIGASGSGKSTLMNILGCLDRPTSGSYQVLGRETKGLSADQLSELRRNHFGFIFQRYHLLGALSAMGNVEVPAIYAGTPAEIRRKRAVSLLSRLGMGTRVHHRPNQLSGGQQQRVSIARALMNDGEIVLADEPTGALDKTSGEEVLKILDELHQEGKTIIVVTHDMAVAKHAERIIEISDGCILSDSYNTEQKRSEEQARLSESITMGQLHKGASPALDGGAHPQDPQISEERRLEGATLGKGRSPVPEEGAQSHPSDPVVLKGVCSFDAPLEHPLLSPLRGVMDRFSEAFRMALLSLKAHPMRTFLTMLGVIIGISTVIAMVALGNGIKKKISDNMNSFSTNTLTVFPGKSMADMRASRVTTLVDADARALEGQPYAMAVTPSVSGSALLRSGSIEANGIVSGVGEQFFETRGIKLLEGRLFDEASVRNRALEVVIGKKSIETLFPHLQGSVIGKIIWIGKIAAPIIGVVEEQTFGSSDKIELYLPYTSVQTRFLGNQMLRAIIVRVPNSVDSRLAEKSLTEFLVQRHGTKDFFIRNSEEFREKINNNISILSIFVASIGLISLIVGGIGVMNIMLVTVSERINEIGVRMAVGARENDILQQFLIESVLVCAIGGTIGILFALFVGWIFKVTGAPFSLLYSWPSIIAAFFFSTLIGVVFGFMPARNASKLDPVTALARD